MSKTKIVIVQLKEIVYTGIFIGLGLLLIVLLLIMFRTGKDKATSPESVGENQYHAGVYTTQMSIGSNSVNLEVVVDSDHINSLRFVNLEEAVTTMYPLMEPSLEKIATQLKTGASTADIELEPENQYTQKMLLDAIDKTLSKAEKE